MTIIQSRGVMRSNLRGLPYISSSKFSSHNPLTAELNFRSFRSYLRLMATSSSCTSVTSTDELRDVCDALSPPPFSGKPPFPAAGSGKLPFPGTGDMSHSLTHSALNVYIDMEQNWFSSISAQGFTIH